MIVVERVNALPYGLPFTRPVSTARGRFTHRRGWLLSIDDHDDRRGWGDAAPWPGFGSSRDGGGDERVAVALADLCTTHGGLVGARFADLEAIGSWVASRALAPEVAHAVELALLDVFGQRHEVSIATMLSPDATRSARTHALVLDRPDRRAGCLKVKVGAAELDADLARVAFVVASSPDRTVLRLDAGGGWSPAQAHEALDRLAKYDVALIEQPIEAGQLAACAALREHAEILGIALALDEDVASAADLDAIIHARAADAVVIKPMFVGGLLAARALAARARLADLDVIVTNALESAIGRAGAVHLAAGIGGVHGLGGALAFDVATTPDREGDRIAVPGGAGLGVTPARRFLALSDAPRAPTSSERREARDAIPHPLASAALAAPDRTAIEHTGGRVSYRELRDDVARAAHVLRARGIGPKMTVAIEGARDIGFVTWLHAIGWLGAAAAPLPDAPLEERRRLLDALAPRAIVDAADVLPARDAPMLEERFWPPSETRLWAFTSGTTGAPEPVPLSTHQLMLSAFGSAIRLGLARDDRWLCCLPLNHVAGLSILFRSAWYATTVVLHPRFDARRVALAIDDGDVSVASLVPAMLAALLDARPARRFPNSLRALLVGGAAIDDELLARARALDAPLALSWGMTEAASQIATTAPGEVGPLAPLCFARVTEHDGSLTVHGPLVGGTLRTADRGRVLDGRVEVHGRRDDVIVSGGEKIAPGEIEAVLRGHHAVRDAVVVSTASPRWGARPVAAVELCSAADERGLRAHCRERLSSFKIPDRIICLDALPRTALGKVSRRAVAALIGAGAIELKKASGDLMNEGHDDDRR